MSGPLTVPVVRLAHGSDLALPAYATSGAAGLDLLAAVAVDAPLELKPGMRALVPTGIALAVPDGFEAQLRPRSGLAHKHGVTVLNAPGTIDSDYRGEVGVILINHSNETYFVKRGQRIAQLVIAAISRIEWAELNELTESKRGDGGFGSTGDHCHGPI
ncbi:MAG: dUTP diphosphatase [Rhodospirillaceae bacterium]